MAEIKLRIGAIHRSTDPKIAQPLFGEEAFATEFTMLQLRMVSETIALACVVAHGDIVNPRAPKFRQKYSAKDIFKRLSRYHDDFFPRPVLFPQSTPNTGNLIEVMEGVITRPELEKVYTDCLKYLHRGYVHEILAGEPREYRFRDMYQATKKIEKLLQQHVIRLSEPGVDYLVQMGEYPKGKLYMATIVPRVPDKDR